MAVVIIMTKAKVLIKDNMIVKHLRNDQSVKLNYYSLKLYIISNLAINSGIVRY